MTVNELNILEKKKQNRFILAGVFLVFCFVLSIAMYAYLYSINSQIDTLDAEISDLQDSIAQRESDPLIQSYMLYERNKSIFSRLEYISQIPEHVSHIKLTMLRYGLTAQGFSFTDGDAQTKITSDNDSRGFGFEKVSSFVTSYRTDPESPFNLSFINSFSGHDRIQHEALFELKDGIYQAPVSDNSSSTSESSLENTQVSEGISTSDMIGDRVLQSNSGATIGNTTQE